MTTECDRMLPLLHADLDGELDAGQSAALAAHVAGCAECRRLQSDFAGLRKQLRAELPYHRAPAQLRSALTPRTPAVRWKLPTAFAAGALAASLAFLLLPVPADTDTALLASHLRALQPGHLMDVASNDQHNVKPWFDGRLDYSPPVKELAAQGFELAGGRLDYLGSRPVAVLVYKRRLHVIDVYVWPAAAAPNAQEGAHDGYNLLRWTQDGFVFWAVSDLNSDELVDFRKDWLAS